MTTLWELVAGSIVFGWVLTWLPFFGRSIWLPYGLGVLAVGLTAALGYQFGGIFVATFEPFGVMLPALCIAQSLGRHGMIQRHPMWVSEKLVLAAVLLIVLLGTIGVIDLDLYPLLYSGWEPAFVAIVLTLWAVLREHYVVLIAVLMAQFLWLADIGSSNFYDHITHAVLIPALLISLVAQAGKRMFGRPRP